MNLASIPSPSTGVLHLGPLTVHAYGLCIALGVLAAVRMSTRRWEARGGAADDITALATWGVPFGIIGARIYHVVTDYELYRGDALRALAIWDGGLGIWGGIAGGVVAGLVVGRRRGLPLPDLLDMAAPALALAQAIGRIGNYFNQELFGKPTSLPWALRIDPDNRPPGFEQFTTFHPTFLYEALWNLGLCGALLATASRRRLRPGTIFAIYVAGYTFARFFLEGLRIDVAHTFGGLRLNQWTSLAVFAIAVAVIIVRSRQSPRSASTSASDDAVDGTPAPKSPDDVEVDADRVS